MLSKTSIFVRIFALFLFVSMTADLYGQQSPESKRQGSVGGAMTAMPADAKPVFTVATIKPSNPENDARNYRWRGNIFTLTGFTVNELIIFAYDVQMAQIVGAPKWASVSRFDIAGEPDLSGQPNVEQMKGMVRALLAERFQLSIHQDTRVLPVFILSRSAARPILTANTAGLPGQPNFNFRGTGKLDVHNSSMSDFAKMVLQGIVLDRPVLDQTGLQGQFDFKLEWTPDPSQFGGRAAQVPVPQDVDNAPSQDADNVPSNLFRAMREQLGLKLVAAKVPAPVVVVDHVALPSAN